MKINRSYEAINSGSSKYRHESKIKLKTPTLRDLGLKPKLDKKMLNIPSITDSTFAGNKGSFPSILVIFNFVYLMVDKP